MVRLLAFQAGFESLVLQPAVLFTTDMVHNDNDKFIGCEAEFYSNGWMDESMTSFYISLPNKHGVCTVTN